MLQLVITSAGSWSGSDLFLPYYSSLSIKPELMKISSQSLKMSSSRATNYPGRIWVIAHKPVAIAAGLGQMGIHRNIIHPEFGSFINISTILVAADVSSQSKPIDFNPCFECKL
ncbi:MAG: hypothetical protein ACKO1O_14690, partial [Erythrobacter sp.]